MDNDIVEGLLQFTDDRSDGQLRDPANPLRPLRNILIPRQMIRELHLRPGLLIKGRVRGRMLNRAEGIEGGPVDDYIGVKPIYDAVALDPQPMLRLENAADELTTRVIDVLAPDAIGVLHRVTRALAELEIDIRSAKITTIGPQAVDAFYVRDAAGGKLVDEVLHREVERAVLHAIDDR